MLKWVCSQKHLVSRFLGWYRILFKECTRICQALGKGMIVVSKKEAFGQGLTLAHFSAQPMPF
jgi:hypothetical protein